MVWICRQRQALLCPALTLPPTASCGDSTEAGSPSAPSVGRRERTVKTTSLGARNVSGLMIAGAVAGCAGATIGSGVGETWIEHAPYYAGRVVPIGRLGYTPIHYQAGATDSPIFDPAAADGSPVATLLVAMNVYLDSLAGHGEVLMDPLEVLSGTPPDVRFGCELDPMDECVKTEESRGFGPPVPQMKLAVGRPSAEWTAAARERLREKGAEALVVLTLEVGQYWPRQKNWRGSKALDLGTDRTVSLPWLTSLDMPVRVIQITGALIGPDGKAIRIGAEGLKAQRTPIVASGFGAQSLITDEDVRALLSERASEARDSRLVWQHAVSALVAQLTGTGALTRQSGPM
jgi:hypothetical protein